MFERSATNVQSMWVRIYTEHYKINTIYGYRISFGGNENVLKLDCGDVMDAHLL